VVPAEIGQHRPFCELVGDEVAGGRGQHDLTAMTGRGDPRRSMDVHSHVTVLVRHRLPRVEPHPHAHLGTVGPLSRCQRQLSLDTRRDRTAGAGEGDEEAVPLGAELVAIVAREAAAQYRPLLR